MAGPAGYEFWLLHLYGTPYEQGFAQAQLLPTQLREMVNRTWDYFKSQLDIPGLPQWLQDLIAEVRCVLCRSHNLFAFDAECLKLIRGVCQS